MQQPCTSAPNVNLADAAAEHTSGILRRPRWQPPSLEAIPATSLQHQLSLWYTSTPSGAQPTLFVVASAFVR